MGQITPGSQITKIELRKIKTESEVKSVQREKKSFPGVQKSQKGGELVLQ